MNNEWIEPKKDLPFEGEPVEVTYRLSDGQGEKVSVGTLRVNVVDGVRQRTWDIFIPEKHREMNFYARVVIAWRKLVPAETECCKTIGEIARELMEANDHGEVVRFDNFLNQVMSGNCSPETGDGYFHDGQSKTDISVWDKIRLEELKHLPYVIWYSKPCVPANCDFYWK